MEKQFKDHANKGGVYQIKNLLNNKVYVGSAKCFKVRASQHQTQLTKQKHRNQYLQNAWNKDGSQNFLFEVLEVVEGDKLARTTREQHYIDQYHNNWEQCYNLLKNCVQTQGPWSKNPKKTRKKISTVKKGKRYSPATEFKKGSVPWTKINGHSEETKAIIREKSKKIWGKKSHQKKMAKIHSSEEFRTFQGNRIKELWNNPEYKEKRLKYYNSKEIKTANQTRVKEKWADPDFHRKMVLIHNSLESKLKKALNNLNPEQAKYLLDKNWLKEEFCGKKRMIKSIAKELKVGRNTVSKWIKNFGLIGRRILC